MRDHTDKANAWDAVAAKNAEIARLRVAVEDLLVDVSFHLSASTDATLRTLGQRAEAILHTSAIPSPNAKGDASA